jgi:hypothetical protein
MLDWSEKIVMIEHQKRQRWVFETNMYAHKPTSQTLSVWNQRYIRAYSSATGLAGYGKGACRLLDNMLRPVEKANICKTQLTESVLQAKAVRDYLENYGGYLDIQVHDIPAINIPRPGDAPTHKERLLLFNCGTVDGNRRVKFSQKLSVDSALERAKWGRRAERGLFELDLPLPEGYTEVKPPENVSRIIDAIFASGEFK